MAHVVRDNNTILCGVLPVNTAERQVSKKIIFTDRQDASCSIIYYIALKRTIIFGRPSVYNMTSDSYAPIRCFYFIVLLGKCHFSRQPINNVIIITIYGKAFRVHIIYYTFVFKISDVALWPKSYDII